MQWLFDAAIRALLCGTVLLHQRVHIAAFKPERTDTCNELVVTAVPSPRYAFGRNDAPTIDVHHGVEGVEVQLGGMVSLAMHIMILHSLDILAVASR